MDRLLQQRGRALHRIPSTRILVLLPLLLSSLACNGTQLLGVSSGVPEPTFS